MYGGGKREGRGPRHQDNGVNGEEVHRLLEGFNCLAPLLPLSWITKDSLFLVFSIYYCP